MSRRRLLFSVGLILGFVALVVVGLVAMVKSEPDFYVEAELPAGSERTELSGQAMAQYSQVISLLNEPTWQVKFTEQQINAFFQDDDYQRVGGDENIPEGLHAPRVRIEDGTMRVGARTGSGLFSTIVSMEIKIWKVDGEINTLAMEIVSFKAGTLPFSTGTLLDRISEAARHWNIDITWYRHEGHPVAIMRFQADLTRPTFQFDRVELKDGALTIFGRTDVPAAPGPRIVPKAGGPL